jgi:hypothetical protein
MSELTERDWRTLYASAMSEGESDQLGLMIENAEEAIQERLREVIDSFSAFEESELYAALRLLRRVKARLLAAA